jgi:hypothetical protein
VAIEQKDSSFLDEYARFVHRKPCDVAYLQRAEQIINIVAAELYRGLVIEGRLGGCIDTSMTMGRILDLYGVWNYVVRGSLRITFPAGSGHDPFCFWPIDENDGSGREYGHKWLVAPPFSVSVQRASSTHLLPLKNASAETDYSEAAEARTVLGAVRVLTDAVSYRIQCLPSGL